MSNLTATLNPSGLLTRLRRALWSPSFLACSLVAAFSPSFAQTSAQPNGEKPSFGVATPLDATGATRKPVGSGLHEVTIMDAKGFNQPIPVATIRIPSDWVTRGGIEWNRKGQCVSNMMRFGWTASAADGLKGFEIRPGYTWQVQGTENPMNPCALAPLGSVKDFLSMIVNQRYGSRARMVEYRNRADLAQAQANNGSAQGRVREEGGQVIISYTLDGREFQESIIATVVFTERQGNVAAGAGILYAQFALDGKLDVALGESIRKSMQPSKPWFDRWGQVTRDAGNRIAHEQSQGITRWHNDQMTTINLKVASDRSQIRMQTQREISQNYSHVAAYHSLKLSTNGVAHWPSGAGASPHFAPATQHATPLAPA